MTKAASAGRWNGRRGGRGRGVLHAAWAVIIAAVSPNASGGGIDSVFAHAAVAADHRLASEAGLEILRQGGNAVDAAVATSFALSVVRPYSCGIGGGGFMVVHLKDGPGVGASGPLTTTINYRETGIAAARAEYFEGIADPDAATHGGRAVCVPGHVAGMLHALQRYGTMDRAAVLAPAIRLAAEGYAADAHYVASSQEVIQWLRGGPGRIERFGFLWTRLLKEGGVTIGDRIEVPEQGAALRLIAAEGADGFYRGPVARAIVEAVRADGGEMTLEDLASYAVEERPPLRTTFRGRTVLTMGPPSSGGIVLAQVLGILEAKGDAFEGFVRRGASEGGHGSAGYIHLVTEASKHAFADRARWMGDPNFVRVPTRALLDPAYLRQRAGMIEAGRTLAMEAYGTSEPPPDDAGTSHLCVVDAKGNAVACTETINLVFGSLTGVAAYGFILNDEMDDFLARRGRANAFGLDHADLNRPEAGKRPLSCMTPTIVLDGEDEGAAGRVVLLAGGSGGPRIISGTIQVALNVLAFDMPAGEALARPRFHHQWHPDVLGLEDGLTGTGVEGELRALGHATERRQPVGAVQIIRATEGGWQAGSDRRKGGVPAGY